MNGSAYLCSRNSISGFLLLSFLKSVGSQKLSTAPGTG